jgi:hypothetical protein
MMRDQCLLVNRSSVTVCSCAETTLSVYFGAQEMRRIHLSYFAVFMASYAVFLAYLKPNMPASVRGYAQVARELLPVSSVNTVGSSPAIAPPLPANKTANSAAVSVALKLPEARVEAAPESPAVPLQVDYSSPDRMARKLQNIAQDDEQAEHRLAAVNSLHTLASGGDSTGSIRRALRVATTDADPVVAEAARTAYRELTARTESRQVSGFASE